VLNAQAVEFAKERGIAIYARATASALPGADPSADGTVVRKLPPRMPGTVVGIASESDLLLLRASGQGLRVLAFLDDHLVSGKQLHILTGHGGEEDLVSLVVSRENLHDEERVRAQLATTFGERATLVDGFGAVSAIGAGINLTYDNLRSGTRALEQAGLPTYDIATSSFRITWFVDRPRLNEAARALHAALIESQALRVP
jgi:aspartate kinase